MSSTAETTAYFDGQGTRLRREPGNVAIGQGAFETPGGDVVVRKDWKVLTIDVSKVPASFGEPPLRRNGVAISIATRILGCWTGN